MVNKVSYDVLERERVEHRVVLNSTPFNMEKTEIIGVYLSVSCEEGAKATEEQWELVRNNLPYPFNVKLPCGAKIECMNVSELPNHDVPCPCGNSLHWLVKYGNF